MRYKIWCEGYSATGESQPAHFVAEVEAESFKDACIKHYGGEKTFDSTRLTLWGCRLYDNEYEARRSFG